MAIDWSELQANMLENIAEKCLSTDLKTYVMFSCVCCSWHRAAAFVKSTVVLQQQIPLLLLPNDHSSSATRKAGCHLEDQEGEDNRNKDDRNLFDLRNNTWYRLSLPQASNRTCYGTGSEWLLTIGLDREIQLLNPLTGASLPLPSYRTFVHQPPIDSDIELTDEQKAANEEYYRNHPNVIRPDRAWTDNEWFRCYYVKRAFVVHPQPQQEEEEESKLLVVVIYGDHWKCVAVAMPGDSMWTPFLDIENVCDVAYSPTLGLMLFLQVRGNVRCCDLRHYIKNKDASTLKLVDYAPLPPSFHVYDKHYLLESFGDILMVERSFDEDSMYTYYFDDYKLDLQTKEWTDVLDLGDVALFVGNSPATSVKASTFPGIISHPNSIYFNEDGGFYGCLWGPKYNDKGKLIGYTLGGSDMGVYDFDQGKIEPFYPTDRNDYLSMYSVPVWFMPKL